MQEISDYFEQLAFISQRTNDNKVSVDTYKMLGKIMRDWGGSYTKQAKLIDLEIREYFSFIKKEFQSFKDVIT